MYLEKFSIFQLLPKKKSVRKALLTILPTVKC